MAARFIAERNHDCAAVRDALDLAFKDAELRRIDQVIGRIDCQQRRLGFFKVGSWIIIARSFQRVEHIICVISLDDLLDKLVENFICFRKRRRVLLTQHWIAAHEPQHLGGSAQTRCLRSILATVPGGIIANRVDDDATPRAIAPGDLSRQTCQRHQCVHEIGMQFSPQPGVHSAH